MKKLIILFLVALCVSQSWGRAGGGVSVGRSSASSSSSSSASAYRAPSYSAPSVPRPYVAPPSNTTVINNGGSGGGGGGFGSSFLGGMAGAVVGNAITHPTVVAPMVPTAPMAPAIAQQGVAQIPAQNSTVVVQEASSFWSWFWFIGLLALVGLLALGYWYKKREGKMEEEFDPLAFFYKVQQASMDDDTAALRLVCTAGMVEALSGNPEPGRSARKTLTGVTYFERNYGETVEYRFADGGKQVRERWQLSNGRLAGIEVME